MTRLAGFGLAVAAIAGLAGCGDSPSPGLNSGGDMVLRKNWDPNTGSAFGTAGSGMLDFGLGSSGNLTSNAGGKDTGAGSGLAVNAYLWRGTLDTLKFMPLVSADPFGGVIITDWWTPQSSTNERFKATAYILGRQLRADGLRISLFRQVLQNGQWVDAPVDAGKATELEDMVLVKARDLRAQSMAGQ